MTINQKAVFVGHLAEDLQPTHGDTDGETKTFRVLTGPSANNSRADSTAHRSYEVVVRDQVASVISEDLRAGTGVFIEGRILDHKFRGCGPDAETVTKIRLEALNILSQPKNELQALSGCEGA